VVANHHGRSPQLGGRWQEKGEKKTMTDTFPKELTVRAAATGDLEAVANLISTCDIAEHGEPDYTLEDLRVDWQNPELNLKTDTWVVATPGGRVVGYGAMFNRENVRLYVDAYVNPEFCGQGIGTYLARTGEARARQQVPEAPPGVRVSLFNPISNGNHAARALLEREGYTVARHFWRMHIDMDQAPPAAEWPAGISVRTFIPGQDDRAAFEAMQEAFRDHWGHVPWRFETWRQLMIKREDFDPSLWFLAMDGDEIAGGSLCFSYSREGWVDELGVRRPWRRQGLGLALLHHSFGEFYRRGQHRVALGVDSQSTTGATRLYQRAGMHIARQYDSYQKELRPGKDPVAQEMVPTTA
jgi:mycothiol synthase